MSNNTTVASIIIHSNIQGLFR